MAGVVYFELELASRRQEEGRARWTVAENKPFKNALVVFDNDAAQQWHNVVAMIPGKMLGDVIMKYKELEYDDSNIEAGLVPISGYTTYVFALDWVNGNGCDAFNRQSYVLAGKKSSSIRPVDLKRRKGFGHLGFSIGMKALSNLVSISSWTF